MTPYRAWVFISPWYAFLLERYNPATSLPLPPPPLKKVRKQNKINQLNLRFITKLLINIL